MINFNLSIPAESFPHQTGGEHSKPLATIANLQHLFEKYGITCSYDEILKKQIVAINDDAENDLTNTSTYAEIKSLMAINRLPLSTIDLIPALIAKNQVNPIVEFITSKKWDKRDRIGVLLDSLTVSDDDKHYKKRAVVTWLIQCVAAADSARSTPNKEAKAKYELVLVLQGGQGLKKTSWFQALLPREMNEYIIDGAHLDPSDKDSVIKCVSGWICELGELDATFRKSDIARLKAFLSNQVDVIRLPYDKTTSNFKRRTSFCASVNPNEFLNDSTGARRFLPLAITGCNYQHNIDLQQLWAQVWELYSDGTQWWCDSELETMLEIRHAQHTETNSIHELISDRFDVNQTEKDEFSQHLSITRILANAGIGSPNNQQTKQAKEFLEKCGFSLVREKGNRGYWINMR